mmetsp:Transcript_52189/g.91119  ORF Transcript_52189/g.91119 Transcript_52189/m.91119 type:complete len:248 (+) Transcript_52189:3974-4717(+)
MLITKEHRPAAALFLVMMISGVKCSKLVSAFTSEKLSLGMVCSSTPVLMAFRYSMYSGMEPSSCFLQASQLLSLTLPFFCTTTLGCTLASSTIVDANTSSTPAGGLAMVFASPRSFLSRVLSAAIAASTIGSALARSSSVVRCFSITSAWITATSLACTCALAVSTSTMAFSLDTTSAIPSATVRFWSASSRETFRSASMLVTAAAVSRSFSKPLDKRLIEASAPSRLRFSKLLYSLRSSKKDLGVV